MNKNRLSTFAAVAASLLSLSACNRAGAPAHTDTDREGTEIFFADPTVFVENGKYYLSGTRNQEPLGFALLESDNLRDWHYARPDSMILRKGEGVFGDKGFWAPQFYKLGDKYLYLYTANEQVAMAQSDSISGLFTQQNIEPIDASEKNIDPFLFRDDDGKFYLYHVRFNHGNFLWVAEFNPETGHIAEGTLRPVFKNTQPWEHTGAYPSDPIMEGPTLIKLDGTYYLFYSANHFMSPDYAVGYATAPSPLGPWTKNEANPVISRKIVGEKGSGHGDVFTDRDGTLRYVYHVHNSDSVVSPRRTRIVTLRVDKSKGQPYSITADPESVIVPVRK